MIRRSPFDAGIVKVWITRAQPGADATAARLSTRGYIPLIAPLLEVHPLDAEIDLAGVQALAFTSRNAVTAFAAREADRALPVFTVGDATARAARDVGFETVRSADGDLAALAALIRETGAGTRILNPGAARPAGDLADLVAGAADVRSVKVYDSRETRTPPPDAWEAVLIHSPRAARALAERSPDTAGRIAVAISAAAAEALSALPFADIRIAVRPNEDALLDALSAHGAGALGNPGPAV